MTHERWQQIDPRLRAAWEHLAHTGKRRFHDEDPELTALMQRAFLRCGPHACRYSPWFDGGGQQFPADYIAYLWKWTEAWAKWGQDPNGLRDRYMAERDIRNRLGTAMDQKQLAEAKAIAAGAFGRLGGKTQ